MSACEPPAPVIGLVGGVGSGKSAAAEALAELGCAVIDADALGHAVLDEPEVRRLVEAEWGAELLAADGSVDRGALGRIVFADPAALAKLNAITHPRIGRRIRRRIAEDRAAGAKAVILDAAVLFEAGWDALCDVVAFVDASPEQRFRRVCGQRGWSREAWRAREKSQIPLDTKRARCDYTLDNRSGVSHLLEQVRELLIDVLDRSDRSS